MVEEKIFWRSPHLLKVDHFRTLNCGVGGDRLENVLYRIQQGLVTRHSMIVVLQAGINNFLNGDPPEAIVNGLEVIFQEILRIAPMCKIFLGTILPIVCNSKVGESLRRTNELIRTQVKSECRVTLVDHDRLTWHKDDGTL